MKKQATLSPARTESMQTPDKFWDKRSKSYDRTIQRHDAIYEERIRKTVSLLKETDVVLDFACATGEITLDIAPHVRRIHGCDVSEKMINLAMNKMQERPVENITFSRSDAFSERLASHSFSAITAFNIFHLLDDAPAVLNRLHELLAPGGLLISETPCLGERSWAVRSCIWIAVAVLSGPKIRNFTVVDLESFLANQSFEILETKILHERNKTQWIVARKV